MLVLFEKISKVFRDQTKALEEISFTIDRGEFVFLVGPSGAGKTTLLRLLIRDLKPTVGKIILDKQDITKLPRNKIPHLRRQVGMVFQDFKLLPDRTVAENVAITLEILGRKAREIDQKIREVLELVGLEHKINYFPTQLSAGELQRTVIARAIVGGPKLIMADEPTGNLDPATSWEILKALTEINRLGTTVIMATHNVDIVNSLGKRVIELKKGKLVKDEKKGKYT